MNTTTAKAAAQAAGVAVATIRAWCRTGVVAATKQAGRWIIDTASLTYRIALPALLRPVRKAVQLTAETITAVGGRRWTNPRTGQDRFYFNDWAEFAGLDVDYYKSGNVCGATLGGRGIANGRVAGILGKIAKVWFDTTDNSLHVTGWDANAVEVRYLDGQRDTVDLAARIRAGITAAVAAL
jgi:hypothetical protein